MLSSSRFTTVAAMLSVPLVLIALTARGIERRVSAQADRQYVDAPDDWVPFSAEVQITKPDVPPVVGRFYRASDGSRRLETGPSANDMQVVHIANVADATTYVFTRGAWIREPGFGPAEGAQPPRWPKGLPNWSVHPYRLAIRRGDSGSVSAAEGFMAYRVVSSQGVLHLKVPDLNLFDAVTQRPDGRYEAYTNIEVGEPAPELFRPPVGAVVSERTRPRPGIPTRPHQAAPR